MGSNNIFPQLSPLSGLKNLRYHANGAPDTSALSKRETDILFKMQNGAYDTFASLSPAEQLQVAMNAKSMKTKDVADVLVAPYKEFVKDTGLYDQVKSATGAGSGVSSKNLRQMSVDPNYDPALRLAFKMRADAKTNLTKTQKQNVSNMIAKMVQEDPAAEKARTDAEEADQKALRAIYGLDNQEA